MKSGRNRKEPSKFETSEWFKISHTCYVRGRGQNWLAFEWFSQHWFSIGAYHSSTPVFNEPLLIFSLCRVPYRCFKPFWFWFVFFFVLSMLCFGVSPLFFSVNCCKVFNTNGLSSHDENFVLFWHILSISTVKLLNKNAMLRHRTKQWKVEPQTDKKV